MRARRASSTVTYGSSIVSGLVGIGLCCFFGFGEVSSPTVYNFGYIVLAALMVLLIVFGYRGTTERRKVGDEVWWQLLIIGLTWLLFLALFVIFIFNLLAMLSQGRTTIF